MFSSDTQSLFSPFTHAQEEIFTESNPGRDADCKRFFQKEKIVADSLSGIFSERVVEKEEETQDFADAECVAERIAICFSQSERDTRGERNAQGIRVAEEERRASFDFVGPDLRLR